MAPNNALGNPTASSLRRKAEGQDEDSPKRLKTGESSSSTRIASADGFGAGAVSPAEVASRGTGSAKKTPLEEFEAQPNSELRCFFTGLMFITRLPCPGWCNHHPGYLMRGMAWFPLLGSIVGVWASTWFDAFALLWSPSIAAACSAAATLWLTGCFHEDGLCDTVDAFGGGWTKSQILRIMKDSRCGSYAVMVGSWWVLTKAAALGSLGTSQWNLGNSTGAGPALLVGNTIARATAAPLIYFCDYIVDDEDAKGEYYNWFGESRRLLGLPRVFFALASAAGLTFLVLPAQEAASVVVVSWVATILAGMYGNSVLGGVMGDFLGATICITELAVYLTLGSEIPRLVASAEKVGWLVALLPALRLIVVVAVPQMYKYLIRGPLDFEGKEC